MDRSSDRHSSAQAPKATQNSLPDRPLPPTPPTPRRSKLDQPSLEANQRTRRQGGAPKVMASSPSREAPGIAAAGTLQGPMRPSLLQRRLLLARQVAEMLRTDNHQQLLNGLFRGNPTNARTQDTVLPTGAKESGTLGSSSTAKPEHTREVAQRVQHGSQGSTPSSDSEEVVIIESEHAKASQPMSMADPQSKETMASGPRSQASASSGHSHGIGPGASRWTREDTQLSKAMSQLLRHKSNLTLDQAGYAKLSDMLVHPRLRNLNPTLEWMMHIVRLNAKQRFALNEAGTHIRAKQGHSIKVDPSKLLRKLGTGDIGDMIPTCALHSTYFSNVPSIMQIGLLPGGTRGAKYRQHIHLAISHRPDAGLREGSDLILMVDLHPQQAGCVFYISDNSPRHVRQHGSCL